MASEIKVDTISEKTSANGVTIDSVVLKDNKVDVNGTAGGIILDADADTHIGANTDDVIVFTSSGTGQVTLSDGAFSPVTDNDVDLGTNSLEFKDGYFDGDITSLADILDKAFSIEIFFEGNLIEFLLMKLIAFLYEIILKI